MYYATSKVPRTLLVLTQCILPQVQVQTVGSTGREPKPPVAVTIGAASAAGAGAKYSSTCASAAKKMLVLAQCTSQQTLATRTLREQARRIRRQSEHEVRATAVLISRPPQRKHPGAAHCPQCVGSN